MLGLRNATRFVPGIPNETCGTIPDTVRCEALVTMWKTPKPYSDNLLGKRYHGEGN
jgi:hypothetical protein